MLWTHFHTHNTTFNDIGTNNICWVLEALGLLLVVCLFRRLVRLALTAVKIFSSFSTGGTEAKSKWIHHSITSLWKDSGGYSSLLPITKTKKKNNMKIYHWILEVQNEFNSMWTWSTEKDRYKNINNNCWISIILVISLKNRINKIKHFLIIYFNTQPTLHRNNE